MHDLASYGDWRTRIVAALEQYRDRAQAAGLLDAAATQRVARALARLRGDRLSVAFVAEFSRGKSELINAIFFAGYGQRILPSSAGRTTMCPTELAWEPAHAPGIRLLPIDTRAGRLATSDYREDPSAWTVVPFDLDDAERMRLAFQQICRTRRVTPEEAQRYGLHDPDDADAVLETGADGLVEIPQWRHALINFPHPLLQQGLVILDTPGLNAIGTEPELTLNLIPNADAVLFVLAAETGVTRSDIDVWRTHIGGDGGSDEDAAGRIVVLNKIDALWDELRSPAENDAAIARQQQDAARLLGVPCSQVIPVSARKGLVGKINGDPALVDKSRIGELEAALFGQLIPARQALLRRHLAQDLAALDAARQALLGTRMRDLVEQSQELESLRGKNRGVVDHMMRRVELEKKEFDASLFKLQGTRAVFATLSTELYSLIGVDAAQQRAEGVRTAIEGARFSMSMRAPVRAYFDASRATLHAADAKVGEIAAMMESMTRRFALEHALALAPPPPLSLAGYRAEIDGIEAVYQKQFGTAALIVNSRGALLERFFDSIASRVRRTFRAANQDVEAWLKVLMAPLEAQIRQHREQLRRRQASIARILDATDSLDHKIAAFAAARGELDTLRDHLAGLTATVADALRADLADVPAARHEQAAA